MQKLQELKLTLTSSVQCLELVLITSAQTETLPPVVRFQRLLELQDNQNALNAKNL
jgi:hypothetical protein